VGRKGGEPGQQLGLSGNGAIVANVVEKNGMVEDSGIKLSCKRL